MRSSFSGNFHCARPQDHHWRMVRSDAPGVEIHAIGNLPPAELPDAHCTVSVEWRGGDVELIIESPRETLRIPVRSAFIHEPLPSLYDALPLARFDARAKRFWRWVFRVVRLPGGGRLLGTLARRG